MEISTIIGIIITVLIMLYGLKLVLKKPNEAEPSLDSALHIDPASQQPVIPRHVRNQLQEQERVEPALSDTAVLIEDEKNIALEQTAPQSAVVEPTVQTEQPATVAPAEAVAVATVNDTATQNVALADEPKLEQAVLEVKKAEPEFTLNSKVEKAEISDFDDESSILDAHLHEQKRVDEESALATAETFVALNIYPERRLLSGEKTLKVLLKYGLRYGEMQCFHRYNEDGSKLLFSVLQITKDGLSDGFDLETLSTEEVKGLAFFMALPHSDVQNAFDTMDSIARLIAREVEGTVYDQNNQEFTPQLREHWRHLAIDFRTGQELGS